MEVISQNIANANTTKTEEGGPYRRQLVHFDAMLRNQMKSAADISTNNLSEVRASKIIEDSRPFREVYQPGHPDANEEGYVAMPNINTMQEMVNLMEASRSYEANVAAFNASKSMWQSALDLGRGMG